MKCNFHFLQKSFEGLQAINESNLQKKTIKIESTEID